MKVTPPKLDEWHANMERFYKFLYAQRVHLYKKFNDESISDEKYFKTGISYDIVNNTLSIILNSALGNTTTIGIDNNARAIIEAFVILEIDKRGLITEDMKRIYRLSYSAIENHNERFASENGIINSDDEQTKKDYDEFIHLVCDCFFVKKQSLETTYANKIKDPYLFLLKDLNDKTNFESIARSYSVDTNKYMDAYRFFSLMIHPNMYPSECEERIQQKRKEYLEELFKYIISFLENELEKVPYNNVLSLSSKLVSLNSTFGSEQEKMIHIFTKFQISLTEHALPILSIYCHLISQLCLDMLICYYFKIYDQVIPKYKSFIEWSSILTHFLEEKNSPQRDHEMLCFYIGSYYRLEQWIKDAGVDISWFDKEIEDAFREHYGRAYSVNGVNGLKTNLKGQMLYFMKDKEYSFRDLVKDENKMVTAGNGDNMVYTIYEIALDMEHASGYAFNQSADADEYYAALTIFEFYNYLDGLLASSEENMKKNNPSFDGFAGEMKFLRITRDKYMRISEQIFKRSKR